MNAGGHLSVGYGKMGFNIQGKVEGSFKDSNISKSTKIETSYKINPSFTKIKKKKI